MAGNLTKEQLALSEKNRLILETVDGPIAGYMAVLKDEPERALKKIASDFKSSDALLYAKGQRSGFNINGNRFSAVLLNSFFYIKNYQKTIDSNHQEYKILQTILHNYEYAWQNPVKAATDRSNNYLAFNTLYQWLNLESFEGETQLALQMIQSIFLLIQVSIINASSLTPLLKAFIPKNFQETALEIQDELQINYNYFIEANTKQKNTEVDINNALKKIVNKQFDNLLEHVKTNSIAFKGLHTKLVLLSNTINQITKNNHPIWFLFSNRTEFAKLLDLLNLSKKEKEHWLEKYKVEHKIKQGKDRFILRKHSRCHLNKSHVLEILNRAGQSLLKQYLKEDIALNWLDQIDEIIIKAQNTCDPSIVLNKKLEAHTLIANLSANIHIHSFLANAKITEIESHVEDCQHTDQNNTNDKKYLYRKAFHEITMLNTQLNQNIKALENIKTLIQRINNLLAPLKANQQKPIINHQLLPYLKSLTKEIFPDVINTAEQDSLEFIQLLIQQHQELKLKNKQAKQTLSNIIEAKNHLDMQQAICQTRKQLESAQHQSIWAKLLRWFSPSYHQCLSLCENFFKECDITNSEQLKDRFYQLKSALFQCINHTYWWDIATSKALIVSQQFERYTFFKINSSNYQEESTQEHSLLNDVSPITI